MPEFVNNFDVWIEARNSDQATDLFEQLQELLQEEPDVKLVECGITEEV